MSEMNERIQVFKANIRPPYADALVINVVKPGDMGAVTSEHFVLVLRPDGSARGKRLFIAQYGLLQKQLGESEGARILGNAGERLVRELLDRAIRDQREKLGTSPGGWPSYELETSDLEAVVREHMLFGLIAKQHIDLLEKTESGMLAREILDVRRALPRLDISVDDL